MAEWERASFRVSRMFDVEMIAGSWPQVVTSSRSYDWQYNNRSSNMIHHFTATTWSVKLAAFHEIWMFPWYQWNSVKFVTWVIFSVFCCNSVACLLFACHFIPVSKQTPLQSSFQCTDDPPHLYWSVMTDNWSTNQSALQHSQVKPGIQLVKSPWILLTLYKIFHQIGQIFKNPPVN